MQRTYSLNRNIQMNLPIGQSIAIRRDAPEKIPSRLRRLLARKCRAKNGLSFCSALLLLLTGSKNVFRSKFLEFNSRSCNRNSIETVTTMSLVL